MYTEFENCTIMACYYSMGKLKAMINKEYIQRDRKLLKTSLYGIDTIKAINIWGIPFA